MELRDGYHLLEKKFILIGFVWGILLGELLPTWIRVSVNTIPTADAFLADLQPLQTVVFYLIIFIVFYFLWKNFSRKFMLILSPILGTVLYWLILQPRDAPFPDVGNPLPTLLYLLAIWTIILIPPFYISTWHENRKRALESVSLSVVGLILIIASLLVL